MGVRISRARGVWPVIRIDGKLEKAHLSELSTLCQSVKGPIVFDLSNLLWADNDGIKALVEREQDGARLHGVSPLLGLLLRREKPA